MKIFEDWDQFYMSMAFYVAMKSEDDSTHVGAVIVNQYNRAVSFGYNGLPTGVLNTENKNIRPNKYLYFEHAERNSIYNAEKIDPGCRIYVNQFPCPPCVRGLIQKRIEEVIYHVGFNEAGDVEEEGGKEWVDEQKASYDMLIEAKIKITPYYGLIISKIGALKSGKTYKL